MDSDRGKYALQFAISADQQKASIKPPPCSAKMPRLASRRRLRELLHGRLQQRGDFGPIRRRCSAPQEPGHRRGHAEHLPPTAQLALSAGRTRAGVAVDAAARTNVLITIHTSGT